MLVTITNLTALELNGLDSISGGVGPSAVLATGGSRLRPLPFPFGHIVLAASGNKQLPMNFRDWQYKVSVASPMLAGEEWNQLVQSKTVSVTLAAQTDVRDPESLSLDTI